MKISKPNIPMDLSESENIDDIIKEQLKTGYDVDNFHFKKSQLNRIPLL